MNAVELIEQFVQANPWCHGGYATIHLWAQRIDRGYSVTHIALNKLVVQGKLVRQHHPDSRGAHIFKPVVR